MIREVIVVEGKEDIRAVKAALEAEVLATGGYAFSDGFINRLRKLNEKRGIIIFTDPDFEGERIRRRISQGVPGAKHAFLPQDQATREGDIGIENASREAIVAAIGRARPTDVAKREDYSYEELYDLGLMGGPGAKLRRQELCQVLGIGYCNSKQLVNRLNNFGISRRDFKRAVERIDI